MILYRMVMFRISSILYGLVFLTLLFYIQQKYSVHRDTYVTGDTGTGNPNTAHNPVFNEVESDNSNTEHHGKCFLLSLEILPVIKSFSIGLDFTTCTFNLLNLNTLSIVYTKYIRKVCFI